ncbi:MAG: hypothetical protein IT432_04845 [Phycisphaerales bacterium]|nr:hypothetical protein [Phycisphaerales bacterium]
MTTNDLHQRTSLQDSAPHFGQAEAIPDLRRLACVLELLAERDSREPRIAEPSEQTLTLRSIWTALSPAQRAILRFVARHENTGLTYLSISLALELPALPGSGGRSSPTTRPISDKTVRRHCERLFSEKLLARCGERGPIQLGARGHDLLAALPREAK